MVFTLPGLGRGGEDGGGEESCDSEEGDGDWDNSSENQIKKAKRIVAKKRSEESDALEEMEVSDDVGEEEDLMDKETGQKLTFSFPAAVGSRGAGLGCGQGKENSSSSRENQKNSDYQQLKKARRMFANNEREVSRSS